MIETTYKCDRCSKDVSRENLHSVGVAFKNSADVNFAISSSGYNGGITMGPTAHWCNDCMFDVGLAPRWTEKRERVTTPTPATLEDLVRELVREEIGNNEKVRNG
jgi:hypothetical protein